MELPEGATVERLLAMLEIQPLLVAVEQNREIVPKRDYSNREINAEDTIEIVHFVGGG